MQMADDNSTISVKVILAKPDEHCFSFVILNISHIHPKVVLGRRLLGVFMTVYMPTILMNIVGHSTMYFKPFFFEAQVKQCNNLVEPDFRCLSI